MQHERRYDSWEDNLAALVLNVRARGGRLTHYNVILLTEGAGNRKLYHTNKQNRWILVITQVNELIIHTKQCS